MSDQMADKTAIDDLLAVQESSDPDELTKVIQYTDGHRCEPNGHGDYQFVCPTNGVYHRFIPFFARYTLLGKCQCGVTFKAIT